MENFRATDVMLRPTDYKETIQPTCRFGHLAGGKTDNVCVNAPWGEIDNHPRHSNIRPSYTLVVCVLFDSYVADSPTDEKGGATKIKLQKA